jgi:hypothetical protein
MKEMEKWKYMRDEREEKKFEELGMVVNSILLLGSHLWWRHGHLYGRDKYRSFVFCMLLAVMPQGTSLNSNEHVFVL